MSEIETLPPSPEATRRRWRFEWIPALFLRPRRTLQNLREQENATWITPMVVLTLLALFLTLASAPARQQQAQVVSELPPDFQYWPQEQQQQYFQAQQQRANPLFVIVFPGLANLAGVWLPWLILSSLLHLALTLGGSRGNGITTFNLVAWCSLPLALRFLVQGIALLITRQPINAPGLSGFLPADATGLVLYGRALLAQVDLYWLWMVGLLLIGTPLFAGIQRSKARLLTLLAVILTLGLQALPGYFSARLSNLFVTRPFFF
ncbi:hypothetical protein SE15_00195 [Thermanaerothrix daxensis]|uniref:Yip1 domain-containing protein n=1 Tax=Thermanaerothrix daxensis TaxID=869279 RepID=A0A0P6XWH7_9CHLR|nr:YIP1 family protein [Thermanaerothrix daxensis]KPL83734.1 hypothetical protein SE15_00195 [Thermanaerothrix daxensis]